MRVQPTLVPPSKLCELRPVPPESLSSDEMFYASVFLAAFTLVAFAPQLGRMWRKRSHIGLSFWTFAQLTIAATAYTISFLSVNFSDLEDCCEYVDTLACAKTTAPLLQTGALFVCALGLMLAYLSVFDLEWLHRRFYEGEVIRKRMLVAVLVVVLVQLLLGCVFAALIVAQQDMLRNFAIVCQFAGSVAVAGALVPQMYTSYQFKGVGALSWLSLLLQVVLFSGVTVYVARIAEWYAWVPFLLYTVSAAGIVVFLHVNKYRRDRNRLNSVSSSNGNSNVRPPYDALHPQSHDDDDDDDLHDDREALMGRYGIN